MLRVFVMPKWAVKFKTDSGFPELQETPAIPFLMFQDPSYMACINIIEHIVKTMKTDHVEIVNQMDGRITYMKDMQILFQNYSTLPGIVRDESERRQYLSFELEQNIKRNREEAGLMKS